MFLSSLPPLLVLLACEPRKGGMRKHAGVFLALSHTANETQDKLSILSLHIVFMFETSHPLPYSEIPHSHCRGRPKHENRAEH